MPQRSDCPPANTRLGRRHHSCGEVLDKQDVTMPVLGGQEDLLHGLGHGRSRLGWLGDKQWRDTEQRHRAGTWDKDAASQPPSLADPKEPQRPLAHECLGETLRILRQVINKYPLLNTLETLTAAGTLISKVKGETVGLGALNCSPPAPRWGGGELGSPWRGCWEWSCSMDWWRGRKHCLPLGVVQL